MHRLEALQLPGAQQTAHLARIFGSLPWWELLPAPEVLQEQPGATDVRLTVTAARDPGGRVALLYLPAGGAVRLDTRPLAAGLTATWIDPRSGGETAAGPVPRGTVTLTAPDGEDWVLLLRAVSARRARRPRPAPAPDQTSGAACTNASHPAARARTELPAMAPNRMAGAAGASTASSVSRDVCAGRARRGAATSTRRAPTGGRTKGAGKGLVVIVAVVIAAPPVP